jgi:hypothetical protein
MIYGFGTLFSGYVHIMTSIVSPVFSRLAEGNCPKVHYEINGHHNQAYYLTDSIYPYWSTFMKTICDPAKEKKARFARERECYEGCRVGIWCAPSSLGYCSASCPNMKRWHYAGDDDSLRDHAQHDR